jgi:hypothetical protein
MCGFGKRAPGHNVEYRRHAINPCRGYWVDAKICLAASIAIFVVATSASTNAIAGDAANTLRLAETIGAEKPPPSPPSAPALVVPAALNVEAPATRFEIGIGEHPEDLPLGTVICVSGLPRGITLSGGQANADRGWMVPLWALNELKIRVAPDTTGDFALIVALVDNNGAMLAARTAVLHVAPKITEVPHEPTSPQKASAALPTLVVPAALNVEAPATRFDIGIGEHAEDLPLGTVIRVSGLPKGITLSGGQANADRGWMVPLWALNELKIRVSPDTAGDFALVVALVDNNGATLAESNVAVHIAPKIAELPHEPTSPKNASAALPTLVVPPALNAEASATRFDISIGEHAEDLPLGTVVRVSGLPRGTTLSGGQANADRGWMVPLWALNELKIRVAPDTTGDFALGVALVDNNGATLTERIAVLHVAPKVAELPREPASREGAPAAAPAPVETSPRSAHANANLNDMPPASDRRRSAVRPEKPTGSASDKPTRHDEPKRSRVTDNRNPKSGPCLLEWRFYSSKLLWHVGECRDADTR